MFKGYGRPYDANTALAGAATSTPGRIGIWAPIERAKQFAICSMEFSHLMHWNAGEEAYLDPDEVRQAVERDCSERQPSKSCRGLRVQ